MLKIPFTKKKNSACSSQNRSIASHHKKIGKLIGVRRQSFFAMADHHRVWSIKLADDDIDSDNGDDDDEEENDEFILANSDRILRMSMRPGSGPPLTVSEVCRKAIESSPEWMAIIVQRFQENDGEVAFKFQYGCGYETILLLDGAALPDDIDTMTVPITIEAVVAPTSTEDSIEATLSRPETYGVVAYGDDSKCQCCLLLQ